MSYQDKLKPIGTTTPNYQARLKPMGVTTPPQAEAPTEAPRGNALGNFLGGALYGFSAPGRTVQNLMSKGVDKIFGTQGFGQATKEGFEQKTHTDLDTTSGKVGNVTGEVATYLMPGGQAKAVPFLLKTAGNVVKNTAIGTAQSGDIKEGILVGFGGEALGTLTKPLASVAKGIYKMAIPLSKKAGETKLVQAYKASVPFIQRVGAALADNVKGPITAAETAFQKGLMGTESMIGVQARKANKKIWDSLIEPALESYKGKVDIPTFFQYVREQIVKENPELSRQSSLLKGLESMQADYAKMGTIALKELQNFKSGWDKFVPEKAFRGESVAGAVNEVRKTLADTARKVIHTAIDDPIVKQAYIDYGNLKGLQEWGEVAMSGGKFKGGAGSFISAAKDAVLVPIATIGGQVLYRTAQGIQFIAPAGVKTLLDIINHGNSEE